MATWFEKLTGFGEESGEQVRENIVLDGETLASRINGRSFRCGRLETPSLAELRERIRSLPRVEGKLSVREVVGNVRALHTDASNAGAFFQVASQFNLLEMITPSHTPEHGVGIYENDHTQGPTCAIAAGAGTIYRNYFAEVNGRKGQTADNQIDCLKDLGEALSNADGRLWTMKNGYIMTSVEGLAAVSDRLRTADDNELDELRGMMRIGVQSDTEVTVEAAGHTVTQAYCSALPVAYNSIPGHAWTEFASLVLEAAYEATLCSARLNAAHTGNNRVYLTLLGGGVFGNATDWIMNAIERALRLHENSALEVAIVSYGGSKPPVRDLVAKFQ
ncbi:MAG: hypothetical protein QUS14_17445 [Pyrinomonadaceae bacterium]|nr:hypothetical protein [Pyrinomonadaceae bacterium]